MRIAIRYARSGPATYISHLDMQRAIGRAIRRAHVPSCYSHGFNPHLQMSFASPLSVGYATNSDYVELEVEDGTAPEHVRVALDAAFPPHMEVRGVYAVPDGFGKLMARNDSAEYTVEFGLESPEESDKIDMFVRSLSERDSWTAVDRKGRQRDLLDLVESIEWKDGTLRMRVANASGRSLNPAVVADAMLDELGLDRPYRVCREECYARGPNGPRPFHELFEGTTR